jgi:succinate dehydrogenase / fumarate reductase, iron-sulfur subunit
MKVNLKVWRQAGPTQKGRLVEYTADNVHPDMSFLEMLDVVNESLIRKGDDPIAFDSDCREGICGSCGLVIDGIPHGPDKGATTCQVHMRRFRNGDTITIEPFRAKGFPIIKDLVVDRSAFDRIIAAGGYVSMNVGGAPDANSLPIAKHLADQAMDSAQCIGAAHLFTSAKVTHLGLLPQGEAEQGRRVVRMVEQMDAEGFGMCSNEGECEAVCPKEIPISNIARMNRDFLKAIVR